MRETLGVRSADVQTSDDVGGLSDLRWVLPQPLGGSLLSDVRAAETGRIVTVSHSPAPWRRDYVEIYDAAGKHVVWELGNQNEHDAALIVAAPDLLTALKAVVDLFGSNAPHDFDVCEDPTCGCVRQLARGAIAKAEGR